MDDVNDGLGGILEILAALLSGRVGANVDVVTTDGDLLAVGLVRDAVDLLEVVRIGDDLVIGDEVLAGPTVSRSTRLKPGLVAGGGSRETADAKEGGYSAGLTL